MIAQFNRLDQRNDAGQLWENFIFIERMKHRACAPIYANTYFWRTYEQQEIDLMDELEKVVKSNPFPEAESEPNTLHVNLLFSVPTNPDLKTLESLKSESE